MAKVLHISENSVKDAWLSAVIQTLYGGDDIKTEYDKSEDTPSKDVTALIEVKSPMSEPITRKGRLIKINSKYGNSYEVYGCMADTYLIGSIQSGYIEEIMEGVNDHYIWDSGKSFPYSYHDRIFNYKPFSLEDSIHAQYDLTTVNNEFVRNHQKLIEAKEVIKTNESVIWKLKNGAELDIDKQISEQIGIEKIPISFLEFPSVNQIEYIIQKLKERPFSRRAQAITWRPLVDPFHIDPPCLQRIFMRIKNNQLVMQTTWRSRDLFRAWEANVNGMIRIQKKVAQQLDVNIGHYLDFSNSLHIYGTSIPEAKDMLLRMKNKGELPKKFEELIRKENN